MRTKLCDLLGIDHPIIQAGMGSFTSPELVAAVSNAGALGSIGAATLHPDTVRAELVEVKEMTNRPFAVNHTMASLNEQAFEFTLEAQPKLVSFAMASPGKYVEQAHDAGALVMLQVPTVRHAVEAVDLGVDIIIAQGAEAGGFGGSVSTLALVPQIVDVAGDIPVVAAGGIADGRGLAAALMLGAQGANVGTAFLASTEAPINESWKQNIIDAQSEDPEKFEVWGSIFPGGPDAYPVIPRLLSSEFVDKWRGKHDEARQSAQEIMEQVGASMQERRWGDLMPFTGQIAGMITGIRPVKDIVAIIISEAEEALERAPTYRE